MKKIVKIRKTPLESKIYRFKKLTQSAGRRKTIRKEILEKEILEEVE